MELAFKTRGWCLYGGDKASWPGRDWPPVSPGSLPPRDPSDSQTLFVSVSVAVVFRLCELLWFHGIE